MKFLAQMFSVVCIRFNIRGLSVIQLTVKTARCLVFCPAVCDTTRLKI